MKILVHTVLLLLVVAGLLHDVPSASTDVTTYNFNEPSSPSSMQVTTPIYLQGDCEAIHQHFFMNPIPTSVIDAETGREIMGSEVWCDGVITNDVGQKSENPDDVRMIPRAFGWIKVYYRPRG